MTTRDEIGPSDAPSTGPPADLVEGSIDRHPTAIGRRLDIHLAAVAEALRDRGIRTGSPRRTDAGHRLIGSIVLDCTAVLSAARNPSAHPDPGRRSLDGVVPPGPPAPVIATWDEQEGWCVGLHEDPTRSSQRYLHADLFPPPQHVAGFVVELALGTSLGSPLPLSRTAPGLPRLRLVR